MAILGAHCHQEDRAAPSKSSVSVCVPHSYLGPLAILAGWTLPCLASLCELGITDTLARLTHKAISMSQGKSTPPKSPKWF